MLTRMQARYMKPSPWVFFVWLVSVIVMAALLLLVADA